MPPRILPLLPVAAGGAWVIIHPPWDPPKRPLTTELYGRAIREAQLSRKVEDLKGLRLLSHVPVGLGEERGVGATVISSRDAWVRGRLAEECLR
jgi:hypothetical protein